MQLGVEGRKGVGLSGEGELGAEADALVGMRERGHELLFAALMEPFGHQLRYFGSLGMRLVGIESDDPASLERRVQPVTKSVR